MNLKNPTMEQKAYHLWQLWLNAVSYSMNEFNEPETESIYHDEDDDEADTMNNAVSSLKSKVSQDAKAAIKSFDAEWWFAPKDVRIIVKTQILADGELYPIIKAWLALV